MIGIVVPGGVVATLIVVCLVVVCGLVISVWLRRRVAAERTGMFRCRIRPSGDRDGTRARPRGRARAHWVHDVLIVRTGWIVHRTRYLSIRSAHGHVDDDLTRGTNDPFISLQFELEDGAMFRVSARPDHANLLSGPFLAAHATFRRSGRPAAG
jgi:hypothetical protein